MLTKQFLFDRAKQDADLAIRCLCSELIRHKISQQQLSDVSHVDKGNLSKILSGVVYPNFKTWCRLRVAVNFLCHPEWFGDTVELDDNLPF